VEVFLDGLGNITIGSHVHIAMRAMLLTGSHEIGGPERRGGRLTRGDVLIGDGVWVGAGAIILPGVTVGPGAVVAAGAVVTKSCEANALYAGVPARLVHRFDDLERHVAESPAF
jgi:Acetyltransferase (isoleucine patch superfamily)